VGTLNINVLSGYDKPSVARCQISWLTTACNHQPVDMPV